MSASLPASTLFHRPSRAFTLGELLVVVGIIALLIAILLPVISNIRTSADRSAQSAALNSVAQALEAYQGDHGDIPRFDPVAGGINDAGDRGARLLARALFGPAPKTDSEASNEIEAYQDGHDGMGFRPDRQIVPDGSGGSTFYFPGQTYGPYLETERWRLGTTATGPLSGSPEDEPAVVILDRNDRPVLYYPARLKEPDIYNQDEALFVEQHTVGVRQAALYNAVDNNGLIELNLLRRMLGDANADGNIDGGEEPATRGPFLLIASDDEAEFSPDSVANFQPAGRE